MAQRGYPMMMSSRARALSDDLGISVTHAQHLQSGAVMPDYPELLKLSAHFRVEPGFFLDANPKFEPSKPEGPVVEPANQGESFVYPGTPPFEARGMEDSLFWTDGITIPQLDIERMDVVVFGRKIMPIRPQRGYLLEFADGDHPIPYFCDAMSDDLFHLQPSHTSQAPLNLHMNADRTPSARDLKNSGVIAISPLVSSIRSPVMVRSRSSGVNLMLG